MKERESGKEKKLKNFPLKVELFKMKQKKGINNYNFVVFVGMYEVSKLEIYEKQIGVNIIFINLVII